MNSTLLFSARTQRGSAGTEQVTLYWRILDDRAAKPLLRVLAVLTILTIGAALAMALLYAPREATMGDAQRIFYFHVPSAWVGFLAFFVVFVGSALFLLKRNRRWDALALSAAEIGVVFTSLVLLTGPLWAKAAWGAFWVWDARLTTALVLWLIYVGYLKLRDAVDETKRGRLAAVVGILGFLDVPIIYLSVSWWRTMHPGYVVSEAGGLTKEMTQTLMVALLSFTLLFVLLLLARLRLEQNRERLSLLRDRARSEG